MIKKRTHFLRNKDLVAEVIVCKNTGKMSNELARMLMLMTEKLSKKSNFANYTYIEDMRSFATMCLVNTWSEFDPARSNNAFAFYTQCIINSFVQYLNQERKQRDIRDKLLVDGGLNPSFTYQLEHEASRDDDSGEPVSYRDDPKSGADKDDSALVELD